MLPADMTPSFLTGPFKNDEPHEDVKRKQRARRARTIDYKANFGEMQEYFEERFKRLSIHTDIVWFNTLKRNVDPHWI